MDPLLGLMLSLLAFTLSIETLCKIEIKKPPEPAESEDAEKKNNDDGYIGFFKSLTPLGLGISASMVASFMYTFSNGGIIEPKISLSLFVRDTVIFTLLQIISFTIFFYIVYGVLSLVNSHNGNETDRRNAAGWANVIVSFVCIFIASQL